MNKKGKAQVSKFGELSADEQVSRFKLGGGSGLQLEVIDLGATIVSLHAPDRDGHSDDVVPGFDNPQAYQATGPYFGSVIGRYANRIAGSKFSVAGNSYHLEENNGANHLHGGAIGFDKRLWSVLEHDQQHIDMQLFSPDGDQGYPGDLSATVSYILEDQETLRIRYAATTTKPTIVNLTQHSYFNLAGHGSGNAMSQQLTLNADAITEVDAGLIPTGKLVDVEGTPFDFRQTRALAEGVDSTHQQMELAGGYDHNFVLKTAAIGGIEPAAILHDPGSGRTLSITTTEPGLQVYTTNALDEPTKGKGGVNYQRRCAVALETQHFPDSPNQSGFPTTVLLPGNTYRSETVWRFTAS